jgi:hypothetical protein
VVKKAGEKVSAFYEEERDIMARAASPWLTKLDYAFQVPRGQARSALFRTAMRAPASGSGYGSTDLIESGSNPDPKHGLKVITLFFFNYQKN